VLCETLYDLPISVRAFLFVLRCKASAIINTRGGAEATVVPMASLHHCRERALATQQQVSCT
jgi:hypothetical protein